MNEFTYSALLVMSGMIICAPLFSQFVKRRAAERKLKKQLKAWAAKEGLRLGTIQAWRNLSCIGVDPTKKKVAVLKEGNGIAVFDQLDLKQVRICKPVRSFEMKRTDKGIRNVIRKISLKFEYMDDKHERFIEVYDLNTQGKISEEWDFAQKWAKKVNQVILN